MTTDYGDFEPRTPSSPERGNTFAFDVEPPGMPAIDDLVGTPPRDRDEVADAVRESLGIDARRVRYSGPDDRPDTSA
ncbi:MAG: hypothetical protein M3Y33_09210 [Actinomycetota bacterium]|nr:hypothetical protein [Actinomycetota bacterium]